MIKALLGEAIGLVLGPDESTQGVYWKGDALFVAPHSLFFIGDQLRAVAKKLQHVSVLTPSPYLSSLALRLPYASKRFVSLGRAQMSARDIPSDALLRPKYFDVPGVSTRPLTDRLAAESSARMVLRRSVRFDVVHSHFLGLNCLIGMRLKEKFAKPLVITAYGGDAYSIPLKSSYSRKLAESTVRAADGLIAVSRTIAQHLVDFGAKPGNVRVIPTGFDGSLFSPTAGEGARSKLGLPAGKKILLDVANLVPQKGHRYLLESFSVLSKARSDLVLVLVGGGHLEGQIRLRARELDIEEKVIFAGPRPHDEIPAWINACDVFALPSISEGSPTVIPEAMACGKPVVATLVGGVPDVVTEGEEGYLVPAGDTIALGDAMARALDTRWDTEAITRRAASFSWDNLASSIVQVYSDVSSA